MDRRTFLLLTTVGTLVSPTSLLLKGCRSTSTPSSATPPADAPFQPVGTLSQLNSPGAMLETTLGETPIAVVKNSTGEVVAVSRLCTHAGCTLDWRSDSSIFACPCHDSLFAATGDVVKGPAQQPLPQYAVRVEGESILVQG